MRYRRLGSTGLHVSVVGLGTWQLSGEWGKTFSHGDVEALVGRAGEFGINLIDTAECYGDHLAESLIGRAMARDRDRWIVATKFGHRFHAERMREAGWDPGTVRSDRWSPREVVAQLDASLRALGTEYVDILQSHGARLSSSRPPDCGTRCASRYVPARFGTWGSRSTRATATEWSARPSWVLRSCR